MLFPSSGSVTSSSSDALAGYGWDADWDTTWPASFADDPTGLVPARVVGVDRGWCDLATAAGPVRAQAAAPADPVDSPCTGDWVALRPGPSAELVAVLPRRSVIVRHTAARASHGQALAANVDTAAVVVSLQAPFNPGRVERLLAVAWTSGVRPVLVLTKADLATDPEAALDEAAGLAPGVETVLTSATTGLGLDGLAAVLTGTVVLLGSSGAGKSTLGNALLGSAALATGAVRAQDNKGRHTTVRRELLPLPGGGTLIDTPGLRGVGLYEAGEALERVFGDVEELAGLCRFTDCGHESEPGCAVLAEVAGGGLERRRLESYRKLQRENEWAATRADARLRAERKGKWKAIHRAQRQGYALRDRSKDR